MIPINEYGTPTWELWEEYCTANTKLLQIDSLLKQLQNISDFLKSSKDDLKYTKQTRRSDIIADLRQFTKKEIESWNLKLAYIHFFSQKEWEELE